MSPLSPETFPLSLPAVVAVLGILSVAYQLNARVTPWADWTARADGGYMRSWWSYVVLNGASAAPVVGLVLWQGGSLADVGLVVPEWWRAGLLVAIYLTALALYYWRVVARPPLDEGGLERAGDGSTPATRRQRILGVFAFSVSPGLCEEIVYRGFAVTAFLAFGFSEWTAIAMATVPYVLLHGRGAFESVETTLEYVALGLGFGIVYVWTGSLWVAIVAHAVHNLVVMIHHTEGYFADAGERHWAAL